MVLQSRLLYYYYICYFDLTVKEACNDDLEHIITPINPDKLEELLQIAGYDTKKTKYLIDGFRKGFSLHYQGPLGNCK